MRACRSPQWPILVTMVINPIRLDGWAARSRWGVNAAYGFHAQLTRDEHSDADQPDVWLAPPRRDRMSTLTQLAEAIAAEADVTVDEALTALT